MQHHCCLFAMLDVLADGHPVEHESDWRLYVALDQPSQGLLLTEHSNSCMAALHMHLFCMHK